MYMYLLLIILGKQRNKDQSPVCNHILSSKKKRSNWVLKFAKSKASKNTDIIPGQGNSSSDCVCTGYKRTDEHPMGAGIVFNSRSAPQSPILGPLPPSPVIDLSRFNPEEFPMEVYTTVMIYLIIENKHKRKYCI